MKRTRKLALILALLAAAAATLPVPSHAMKHDLARPAETPAAGTFSPSEDHWSGAAAAVACGFVIRYFSVLGWNFAYNVVAASVCLWAFLDSLS